MLILILKIGFLMTRQLEPFTLGKRACETTLTQILNENPKAIRKTTNLLVEFREGLGYLRSLGDYNNRHFKQLSLLWFEDFKLRVDSVEPRVAAKHLHACIKADWRNFLQTTGGQSNETIKRDNRINSSIQHDH